MKRIVILVLVLIFGAFPIFSQIVTIPDTAFLAALIEEGVDTNEDGQISYEEAEAVFQLDVGGEEDNVGNITDMTGIEAFVNLRSLSCFSNQITKLDITKNSALWDLWCYDNYITELNLSNNLYLVTLYCGRNQLSELDVSKNTRLYWLECFNNQLTSLDVSNLKELFSLWCNGNQLTNLDISQDPNLTELVCGENQLTNLDISQNPDLEDLDCAENQLSELDVSNNTDLIWLNCSDNKISSLDFSNNTELRGLYCDNNELTSLEVSKNPKLIHLTCSNNQLTTLDISNNSFDSGRPKLGHLACSNNHLTTLDISYNTNLGSSHSSSPDLGLANMPSLEEVCIGDSFWEKSLILDTIGSPNICFEFDCSGMCGDDHTGIDEQDLIGPSIYPNPTSDLLTIETDHPHHRSIEITSLSGQLIYRTEMEGCTKQIDMTPFRKGVYFVTVRSKEFVRTEKVVKL